MATHAGAPHSPPVCHAHIRLFEKHRVTPGEEEALRGSSPTLVHPQQQHQHHAHHAHEHPQFRYVESGASSTSAGGTSTNTSSRLAKEQELIELFFAPVRAAKTVEDVVRLSAEASARLRRTGLYASVDAVVDAVPFDQARASAAATMVAAATTVSAVSAGVPLPPPLEVEVRVGLEPSKRRHFRVGTELSPNLSGVGFEAEADLHSHFGTNERIDVAFSVTRPAESISTGDFWAGDANEGAAPATTLRNRQSRQRQQGGSSGNRNSSTSTDFDFEDVGGPMATPANELYGGEAAAHPLSAIGFGSRTFLQQFSATCSVTKPLYGYTPDLFWRALTRRGANGNWQADREDAVARDPMALLDHAPMLDASIFRRRANPSLTRGYSAEITGFRVGIRPRGTNPLWAGLNLSYEGTLRDVFVAPRVSSEELRVAAAGTSVKSSIAAEWKMDERDNPFAPTEGWYARARAELAGLGGDARFVKSELEGSVSVTPARRWFSSSPLEGLARTEKVVAYGADFLRNITFSGTLRAGALVPLDRNGSRAIDRFTLGSPELRGFEMCGVGPRASCGSALGGDVFAATGFFATAPLVSSDDGVVGLQLQAFWNGGSVVPLSGEPLAVGAPETARALARTFRSVVGAGLVAKLPIGRAEFNYAVPLTQYQGDLSRTYQFQLAMSL